MPTFSHLHVHTQFSLLDGAASIKSLYKKAIADGMPALAITDHGNMFGAFEFVNEAYKHKNDDGTLKVKPIVGCEFYVVADRHQKSFTKDNKDVRVHQVLLAKNAEGYQNLVKLTSYGYSEGYYSKYPRIDKELILKYHKGLIATTCCIGASVPQAILNKGEDEAEKEFKWWLDLFGEDYFIELQRHNLPEQETVNQVLLRFAKKHNVPVIATNDSHYTDQEDANAHDILLCVNTGEKQSTPGFDDFVNDDAQVKNRRFKFPNDQFYFKTQDEMRQLFADVPQAIDNTNLIADKVELLNLKREILLPAFPIPKEFQLHDDNNLNQWEYLKHLTYEGAKQRYNDITADIQERIDFELFTIKTMGFAGYFLIVSDFIREGRNMGVFIGPGRGSAAGSAVAYCIGITNIDPIKYNLLFERFLNPDRKSMPDIDTDFDDDGRQKVIDYVVQKYGKNQVAQIVTFGTMAAKSSIKDVARVMDLPLTDSNMLAKLVPDKPGTSLGRVLKAPIYKKEGPDSLEEKDGLQDEDLQNVVKLRQYYNGKELHSKVLREAEKLEGSVRNTGVHAAGIIIAPKDLTDLIPVATAKDSDLWVTQIEGSVIEDAGVIKMDFLGLKTLTIIKSALELIKKNHGVEIEIDEIPLNDEKTYQLYQRGDTNGTFQFESPGMQKYLRDLKPDQFADLIAMNALYRPGPLKYIPNFIKRKQGLEEIAYDLPEMKEILEETYGITVYQEQVMLLSQKLAGFSKGDADVLRKAMGKKQKAVLDKMKQQFVDGAVAKGHPEKILQKVWSDWEDFAQYAFNKSHSTCYAFVAYQTAYLKAHYPAEFMAAVLGSNMSNMDKLTFFMDECKRMDVKVLGPDINESETNFSVNEQGNIRFGMAAIKGVGEGAIDAIIATRNESGPYTDIFDFFRRVNLKQANKKTFENLALAGAFDSLVANRAVFFDGESEQKIFLDTLIRYGNNHQNGGNSMQNSLFGDTDEAQIPEPALPNPEPWSKLIELEKEKQVVGIYLSGHPLDAYQLEFSRLCANRIVQFENLNDLPLNREVTFAGIVTKAERRRDKKGNECGFFLIEDYTGKYEIKLFNDRFVKFGNYFEVGRVLFLRAKIDEIPYRNNERVLDITYVSLMNEARKMIKDLTLIVDINNINPELIDKMANELEQHRGDSNVKFVVYDRQSELSMQFQSKTFKVEPSHDLFRNLEKMGQFEVKLG